MHCPRGGCHSTSFVITSTVRTATITTTTTTTLQLFPQAFVQVKVALLPQALLLRLLLPVVHCLLELRVDSFALLLQLLQVV